jgi:hypothetical protein
MVREIERVKCSEISSPSSGHSSLSSSVCQAGWGAIVFWERDTSQCAVVPSWHVIAKVGAGTLLRSYTEQLIPKCALDSMPTVTVSTRAQYKTVPWPPLGVSHPPSSETRFQQCQSSGISLSPPLQTKRRPAMAMMDSEDEYHTVDSNRTICSEKRQKTGKIRPIETHDRASTARTESKIFQQLQEQRTRLPIARGGIIHKPT